MAQPPRSPTTIPGNPRNRALDIGTDRGGFPADVPYDYNAGCPVAAPMSGTHVPNVPRDGTPFTNAPDGAAVDPKPIK